VNLYGLDIRSFYFGTNGWGRRVLENTEGLKYMTKLEGLYLDYGKYESISSVIPTYENGVLKYGCPNLKVIELKNNENLRDLGYLYQLTSLENINASNCSVVNVFGFEKLINLRILDLRNNSLSNSYTVEFDNNLEYNETLYNVNKNNGSVTYNPLKLFAYINLNRYGSLTKLYLAGNGFDDYSFILNGLNWSGKDF